MNTTNWIVIGGFATVLYGLISLIRQFKAMEELNFSGRLEKLEAHVRYWSFYLGPLGEEARMKKESSLNKEYETLASSWENVCKGDAPKLKDWIIKAYKAYEKAVSDRWDDMLVLDLVDAESWHQQREHRWEMERELEKDPAYALRVRQKFTNLEQAKD